MKKYNLVFIICIGSCFIYWAWMKIQSYKLGHNNDEVTELQRNWERFAATDSPDATYLQIAHNEGVTNVINALRNCSPELRQRIEVLGYGCSDHIPEDLCAKTTLLCCDGSPIPHLVCEELFSGVQSNAKILNAHQDANAKQDLDYSATSPIYEKPLKDAIHTYLNQ